MKITFTTYHAKEISVAAYNSFISTLRYYLHESDSDSLPDDFDSDTKFYISNRGILYYVLNNKF